MKLIFATTLLLVSVRSSAQETHYAKVKSVTPKVTRVEVLVSKDGTYVQSTKTTKK